MESVEAQPDFPISPGPAIASHVEQLLVRAIVGDQGVIGRHLPFGSPIAGYRPCDCHHLTVNSYEVFGDPVNS